MTRIYSSRAVARVLAGFFTILWWWLLVASIAVAALMATGQWQVAVQIGADGAPDFVAGRQAEMVLPVAFELDAGAARVTSGDRRNTGAIERATGLLRLARPDRRWIAAAAAAITMALALWILAELAGLCRSVRDGHPFAPGNVGRIRRLAVAMALGEGARATIVYGAHAYAAAHFAGDHLRLTASPHLDAPAIVSVLILFVLAEVFRTGTRLDEEQSLTV